MFVFELFHIILFVNVIVNDEIVNFYEGQLKVLLLKQKVSADRLFRSALVDDSVKVSIAICIPSLKAYLYLLRIFQGGCFHLFGGGGNRRCVAMEDFSANYFTACDKDAQYCVLN